jgi:hypothetical protein
MLEPQLEHSVIKIRQLIENYRAGQIVIPEFQREYVWKPNRAPKLIDSLYRGYPISSLLLWVTSQDVTSRRRDPRPTRSGPITWLIDGQQRVITLSRCLSGDEGIEIVFNPENKEFRRLNAATEREASWFRLAEIWDDDLYFLLRRKLSESQSEAQAKAREAEFDRVRRILEYEIPVLKMVDHSFGEAVDAFSRINTLGVKLKSEDIESAKIAARHSGFIANEVAPFLKQLHEQGFKRLSVMHLFRACAFIASPDGRRRTPLHELNTNDVISAWSKTKRAAENSLNLVRSELGLVNMDILWSGALLVPIMVLCDKGSGRERNPKALAAWLAVAALFHRYSKSADTALEQDLKACRKPDPIGALLANVRSDEGSGSIRVRRDDFTGNLADKGGLLGVYIACRHRGIRDLFTDGQIIMQPKIERHHILPRGQFSEKRRPIADNIANIAFLSEATNRSINMSGPEVYLAKISEDALISQCIPTDRKLWSTERAEDFWKARRELLAGSLNDFLRYSLPNRQM